MVHSVPELYRTTCAMWVELYGKSFPLSEQEFTAERPNITTMEDYFTIINRILSERGHIGLLPAPDVTKLFYKKRSERMEREREQWLSENMLYDGVPEMMEELSGAGIVLSVVSSKNEGAIRELLEHHRLLKYIESRIIGLEKGKREQQFKLGLGTFSLEPQNTIAYDDARSNLVIAKKMGIIPVGAPQGYGKPGELDGFEIATAAELPAVAGRLLDLA